MYCYDKDLLKELNLPASIHYLPPESRDNYNGTVLSRSPDGILTLLWADSAASKSSSWRLDLSQHQRRIKDAVSGRDLLCRNFADVARRQDKHAVVDVTAGLGRDAFLLAAMGFRVLLVERHPILFHFLREEVSRQARTGTALGTACRNMSVLLADASLEVSVDTIRTVLRKHAQDCPTLSVYIDPMYPSGAVGRRSAVKKDSQILRHLVVADDTNERRRNEKCLLRNALQLASKGGHVVVKRPARASFLADAVPNKQTHGSTHRFDVYYPCSK